MRTQNEGEAQRTKQSLPEEDWDTRRGMPYGHGRQEGAPEDTEEAEFTWATLLGAACRD